MKRARALPIVSSAKHAEVLGVRALQSRERLIETAVKLFLERGFGGTAIDDIAQAVAMSRASFYTYFPSKREILLLAGHRTDTARTTAIMAIADIPDAWNREHLKVWLRTFLTFLDQHGAFQFVWSQAAWFDDELRAMGVKGSLRTAKIIGRQMRRLSAQQIEQTTIEGLAVLSMLERFWYVWKKTKAPFADEDVIERLARMLETLLRPGRP